MRKIVAHSTGVLIAGLLLAACGPGVAASPGATSGSGTPLATSTATTAPAQSVTPSTHPLGTAWIRVDDADLLPGAAGNMTGVLWNGRRALAWGSVQAVGPTIWRSEDGRDWKTAAVEPLDDAWVEEGYHGAVLDVIGGGPGLVAVGTFMAVDGWMTSVVWTSPDGLSWSRVRDPGTFERSHMERTASWRGTLLAFGCALATPTDCGSAMVWASTDGRVWTRTPPTLPLRLNSLGLLDATTDALWAAGVPGELDVGQERPTIISSTDGVTWTESALPWHAPMRVHAIGRQLYATVPRMPTASDDYVIPEWWTERAGIYRSTALTGWTRLPGQPAGDAQELVFVGDTLMATGSAGAKCWLPSTCRAAAWASTDAGTRWSDIPVRGPDGARDDPGAVITSVTPLGDGSLVGVGMRVDGRHISHPALWVLPAEPD